jgi:hypothetical protein
VQDLSSYNDFIYHGICGGIHSYDSFAEYLVCMQARTRRSAWRTCHAGCSMDAGRANSGEASK